MQCLGEFVLADVQSMWMRLQVCIEKWSPQKCGAESDSEYVYTFVLGLFKIILWGPAPPLYWLFTRWNLTAGFFQEETYTNSTELRLLQTELSWGYPVSL